MAQPTAEDYDYEALPPNFSLVQNMVAGAFAGIAVGWTFVARRPGTDLAQEHTVMYPIDAIKASSALLRHMLWIPS
ncbi:hypothetical protein L249_7478 [Ophiocordyceps polyrhachis-furcata BCC 54312]|uniref:Uncharacterized protein n=1 Tax=Ophiocordyceps polyrhachis-furcata BCC 54312 TaxID=1330021 RepID=A0A367LA23_9HYPO|nr:hypothetical protein L249_7478 [Ophiocordyceps polyrhachis-furcata BCC 54312]